MLPASSVSLLTPRVKTLMLIRLSLRLGWWSWLHPKFSVVARCDFRVVLQLVRVKDLCRTTLAVDSGTTSRAFPALRTPSAILIWLVTHPMVTGTILVAIAADDGIDHGNLLLCASHHLRSSGSAMVVRSTMHLAS